jgi:hypothetical protein
MNQLFEEFIAEFIRRELRDVWQSRGCRVGLSSRHGCDLLAAWWAKPNTQRRRGASCFE